MKRVLVMVIMNCNYTFLHQKRGPGATRLVTVDNTGTSERLSLTSLLFILTVTLEF